MSILVDKRTDNRTCSYLMFCSYLQVFGENTIHRLKKTTTRNYFHTPVFRNLLLERSPVGCAADVGRSGTLPPPVYDIPGHKMELKLPGWGEGVVLARYYAQAEVFLFLFLCIWGNNNKLSPVKHRRNRTKHVLDDYHRGLNGNR